MFRLIDITIDIIFFSINWKNYFDRSILVISMTVLVSDRNIISLKKQSILSYHIRIETYIKFTLLPSGHLHAKEVCYI